MMASFLRAVLPRPALLTSPHISVPTLGALRSFSYSSPSRAQLPLKARPEPLEAPEYPHGFSHWYKKSNRGIYGRTRLRVHKQVSDGFPSQKVLTRWKPNVHRKKLWSGCLERYVRIRMVIRILRTIDKSGGLDRYLLGQSPGRIRELGPTGWALRWRILRTPKGIQMWEEERRRLGLPPDQGPRSSEFEQVIAQEVESWRQDAKRILEGVEAATAATDADAHEEAVALRREQDIDAMLAREDQLPDHEGGLDLADGVERERQR